MKKFSFLLVSLLAAVAAMAQPMQNLVWKSEVVHLEGNTYQLNFKASPAMGWHLYDMDEYDVPIATTFSFEPSADYELVGGVVADKTAIKKEDPYMGMVGYYPGSVTFSQKVAVNKNTVIKVKVECKVCEDNGNCTDGRTQFEMKVEGIVENPPQEAATVEQKLAEKPAETPKQEVKKGVEPEVKPEQEAQVEQPKSQEPAPAAEQNVAEQPEEVDDENIVTEPPVEEKAAEVAENGVVVEAPEDDDLSLWASIMAAVGWALFALLTPCVFPMIPMTVSYFIKGSDNVAKGRFRAMMYGLFIVLLYTLPIAIIILLTYLIGGDSVTINIFNWLATHWIPNVIFFIVFMVFAASFFGAFDIVMPEKLVNKSDEKADKGGLLGIFFMALTLVLVSFSCTGPIIGSVLIQSTSGEVWTPIITMAAFSVVFALPFTLFALFPTALKQLPKSGGWLNSVKVVLGFVELALGLKFLSVADMTYGWGLLDREVYLALWIVIFSLLGMYLLGKLRFKHDSEVKHVSVLRLMLAIASFSFVVYMVPGMWGAPLRFLSGYLPPLETQDFRLNSGVMYQQQQDLGDVKYDEFFDLPHGLQGFYDMEQAKEYAKKVDKPIFVDITGMGCVNCRNMEANVWADPKVLKLLSEEYVIVALYMDVREEAYKEDWVTKPDGEVLKTIGEINTDYIIKTFGVNSQPYYFLLNSEGERLAKPRAFDLDVDAFVKFLEEGIKEYKAQ